MAAEYVNGINLINGQLIVHSGDITAPLPTAASTVGMSAVYIDADGYFWRKAL